ncbi:hypothetical protein ASPVEDRAFT_210723 [Aspergillus versicolor CBS 583.65]|uniref:Uncharacterized protein n=1 Tax=Aspergillus versicolor CBS 583.65 TaxID=1036611 RepID=A0A1L9P373_ASPVE|nr:uncharacterized protein ASPVEDRAFT_210723 [Aspergillus versicolor CBS 583.65]OJI95951.1 hypothetical protein ASPVEDRAFT_210723 [Aspergillus versicolor CBS 583.65]
MSTRAGASSSRAPCYPSRQLRDESAGCSFNDAANCVLRLGPSWITLWFSFFAFVIFAFRRRTKQLGVVAAALSGPAGRFFHLFQPSRKRPWCYSSRSVASSFGA